MFTVCLFADRCTCFWLTMLHNGFSQQQANCRSSASSTFDAALVSLKAAADLSSASAVARGPANSTCIECCSTLEVADGPVLQQCMTALYDNITMSVVILAYLPACLNIGALIRA
jgi:hypothetical protein